MAQVLPLARSTPEAVPARRGEIIAATAEAIFRQGYGTASMRDIADALGITQAALYYHFTNKEEILFTIIDDFTDRLEAALRAEFEGDYDPAAGLRRAIRAHILMTETYYREIKIVMEDKKFLSPAHRVAITAKEDAIFRLYRARVAALTAGGRGRDIAPTPAAFALLGVINYFYHWFRPGKGMSLAEVADQSIDLLLSGLLKPGRMRAAPAALAPRPNPAMKNRKSKGRTT